MERNVIKLDVPKEDLSFMPPNEFVPESQKNEEWYRRWCQHWCMFYNPAAYNYDSFGNTTTSTNGGSKISNWNFRITDNMVNNFAYLTGEQPNITWNYLTEDITGQTFQSPWIKGRKAGMIVNFANGDMMETLENITFDAVSLSKDIIAKKQQLFDQVILAHDMEEMLAPMQEMGVSFQPYSKKMNSKEEIETEKLTYKDELERDCIYLADDIFVRNDMKFRYSRAYLNVLCGLGAIYNYVENGKQKKKVIDCWNVIWDNRQSDDFGTNMRFWGFVEYMTPAQALSAVPGLADNVNAATELNAIASGAAENLQPYFSYYNNTGAGNNFQWWRVGDNKQNLVSVVTMFWIAPRDLRFKKYVNDYGQTRIKSIKQESKFDTDDGQYLTMDIHKVQLVGNKWACNFGYAKNTVRDYKNKGNPIPNMSMFIPNQIMGQPQPVMSMIKKNQDEIDRLKFVIRKITGRDRGKIPIINAEAMGEGGKSAVQFADDLENVGVLVARSSGEYHRMMRDNRIVDVVDLSNNSQIATYLQLLSEEYNEMKEIVGYSAIALGQQNSYVSQGVQSATIQTSSNVLRYTVSGFREFMRRDMEYAVAVQKMLIGTGKDKDGELVIGREGIKLMKSMGKERFSDVLVYLKIMTPVDENTRQQLIIMTQQWAANPQSGVLPADVLMLMSEKSLSVMERKLRLSMEKHEMKMTQQQNYQNMIAMIQAKAQQQQQQQMLEQEDASKQAIAQGKNETNIAGKILDHSQKMAAMGTASSQQADSIQQ